MSVLFCDLVGSTALGERLDAEVVRELLSRYYATCGPVLRRHGGLVDKFIGDAVMCVFGLPSAHEDDALRACRAACDLLAALEDLNAALQREWGVRLAVRVGIHTGEAVSGDPRQGQALVTGDVVNTAARLEQLAAPGEILIGAPTYRLVRDRVQVEARDPVLAKGKKAPLPAHRLLGAQRVEAPPLAPPATALFGRSGELDALERAYVRAREAPGCQAVLLVGEAGIGKSRLAAELVVRVGEEARVLSGRCLPYGEGVTYWPLSDMVDQLVGEDDRLLARMLGGGPGAERDAERILRAVGRCEGPVESDECFGAVGRMLRSLAGSGPVVMVIEDLHWAHAGLLALVAFLVEGLRDAPVLVLATSRSDVTAPPGALPAAAVHLGALVAEEAQALLEARGVASPERRREIVQAAGGNPLFLEQLHAAGETRSKTSVGLELRALITARLGELDAAQRETLEAAAVVGQEFWMSALTTLLPEADILELGARLSELERLEFVAPGRALERSANALSVSGVFGGEARYSFRHGLIQEGVRRAMSKRRAASLHERFAAFLEEQAGPAAHQYDASIGWHREEAARLRGQLAPTAPTRGEAA